MTAETSTEEALPAAIDHPYLLVLFGVPFYQDQRGRRFVDRLWAKDLHQHLRYLRRLTVCSYVQSPPEAQDDLVCLDDDPVLARLKTIGLPRPRSWVHGLWLAPVLASRLWRALGDCQIVHSSVAGWPLPEAWFIEPMLAFRPRPHLIIVESAFWRAAPGAGGSHGPRALWSGLRERLARSCLNRASLTIFTHDGYRRSLLDRPERGHVIEASWLDQEVVIELTALGLACQRKSALPGLKLAYFGRLTHEKGVEDLVQACRTLVEAGLPVTLAVYGDGALRQSLAESAAGCDALSLHAPVPYGPQFFETLSRYDAVVVPTRTDEQPRIVFDAYSQGVPVLASNTEGHRQCVEDGVTGRLFPLDRPDALSAAVLAILADKAVWVSMGGNGRSRALSHTHQAMHDRRRRLLAPLLAGIPVGGTA